MSNTNATRLSALETSVAQQGAALDRILALLEAKGGNKAPTARPAAKKAASTKASKKASTKPAKAKASKAAEPTLRHLTRKNRADFVAAHPWAKGMGTSAIAEAVVTGAQTCEAGWAIGAARTERVTTGSWGTPTAAPKAERKGKGKKAKAGKKAGKKAEGTAQVALVAPEDLAKELRPSEGPRNAKGHITPKSEWALRERLALEGFDRFEVDAVVASLA